MRPSKKYLDDIYEDFSESDLDCSDDESVFGYETDETDDLDTDPLDNIDPFVLETLQNFKDQSIDATPFQYTDKCNIKWKRGSFNGGQIPFQRDTNSDINLHDQVKAPIDYFKKYFSDEIYEQFALYTNEYAKQKNVNNFALTKGSEIKILFGLHMLMGIIKLPRVKMYWSPIFNLEIFKSSMTCKRFFQLRNNLHIVNNFEKPNDCVDKFYKVRPVLTAVRKQLLQLEVSEVVAIDEQIIPCKGRVDGKQYVKDKPYSWGLKNFVLCDKNGMPFDFFVYQGSSTELSPSNLKKFGFCASVVLHLVERLKRRGHQLYYDNYFSSYQALEILKAKGINVAGTIRLDRFVKPPLLSDKDLSKNGRGFSDSVVSADGTVVVVKWQDNKPVHLASNFVGIGTNDTAKRWDKKSKKYIEVTRPEIVSLYNTGMGGVDLLDQLISYYRIFIRSRKWPLRVIFHFVDFAICSSWLEYKSEKEKAGTSKKRIQDLLHFRMELAMSVIKIGNPCRPPRRGRPKRKATDVPSPSQCAFKRIKPIENREVRPSVNIRADGAHHLPEHDKKENPTRCKQSKCCGKTFFQCIKCKVHLCISKKRNCFSDFHMA